MSTVPEPSKPPVRITQTLHLVCDQHLMHWLCLDRPDWLQNRNHGMGRAEAVSGWFAQELVGRPLTRGEALEVAITVSRPLPPQAATPPGARETDHA